MSIAAPAIDPCWQMRNLVHRMAEGTLAGTLLKYTTYHVRTCQRCRQAVEILRATLLKLRVLSEPAPELPDARWAAIEAAWLEHEQTNPPD